MSPMDAEVRVYPTDVPRRAKQETNNNFWLKPDVGLEENSIKTGRKVLFG
jgi:hypothetical protein